MPSVEAPSRPRSEPIFRGGPSFPGDSTVNDQSEGSLYERTWRGFPSGDGSTPFGPSIEVSTRVTAPAASR